MLRLIALGLVVVAGNASGGGDSAGGALVLDERAYWRFYLVPGLDYVSGEALRAEGERLLGKRRLASLEGRTKKRNKGLDWKRVDWRDLVTVDFARIQRTVVGVEAETLRNAGVGMPGPPEDWAALDFEDGQWPRQRLPLLMGRGDKGLEGYSDYGGNTYQVGWLQGHYRTRVLVPDPSKVKGLTLTAQYRGGIRVFVNGREVARGHLPKGDLPAGACAEPYPAGAYVATGEELSPRHRPHAKEGTRGVGDFYGPFDSAPKAKALKKGDGDFRSAGGSEISRKAWERIRNLRNRRLATVRIPPNLLRRGKNVLAVELRACRWHPMALSANRAWHHCQLVEMRLRSERGSVPSALKRTPGMQVWVEDIHKRVVSREFLEPGADAGIVRIVGVRNGTFAGQIVLGTEKDLRGVKVTAGPLTCAAGGAEIPARCIRVMAMMPHRLTELGRLGTGRGGGGSERWTPWASLAAWRHVPELGTMPREKRKKMMAGVHFFDHLSRNLPERIAADRCQPCWLSFRIPRDARAGSYRGSIRVAADGVEAVRIPVEVEVLGWRLPDATDFQTVSALEQSPDGVARQYDVPLWSDEHFRLMKASIEQYARVGNDWICIPVIHNTEFGNHRDSPIKWIRGKDGRLKFDYSVADRYIDLAIRHWGKPRIICFVILLADAKLGDRIKPQVWVHDEGAARPDSPQAGKRELLDLDPTQPHYRSAWVRFATSLRDHMKKRGLADVMFWGYPWDNIRDYSLMELLAGCTPKVPWVNAGHRKRHPQYCKAWAVIYQTTITPDSQCGWKVPYVFVSNPRANNSVSTAEGVSLPFAYRLWVNRTLVSGLNGIGRMGADYWGRGGYGYPFGTYMPVYMPCRMLFWPGPEGAESSARYEMIVEGVQETEARIYCEQVLDSGLLPAEAAGRVKSALNAHNRETLHIPSGWAPHRVMEASNRWQERSRLLFAAAAEVSKHAGLTVQDSEVALDVPARGERTATLHLRNWTLRPREWTVAADKPWIVVAQKKGQAANVAPLRVRIVAADLPPEQTAAGSLTFTDVATGNRFPVTVKARVGPVMEVTLAGHEVFNVTTGGKETRRFLVINRSGKPLAWKSSCPAAWIRVSPPAGKLAPEASQAIDVVAEPPARRQGRHESALTVAADDGATKRTAKITTFVIPPYRRPVALPQGKIVYLDQLEKKRLKSHCVYGGKDGRPQRPNYRPGIGVDAATKLSIGKKLYQHGLWAWPYHETTYEIAGAGFRAFSAEVGFHERSLSIWRGDPRLCLNFEVYVDGKLRAQSGIMKPADGEIRLLVVDRLERAKEVKLVTRTHNLKAHGGNKWAHGVWGNAGFHK